MRMCFYADKKAARWPYQVLQTASRHICAYKYIFCSQNALFAGTAKQIPYVGTVSRSKDSHRWESHLANLKGLKFKKRVFLMAITEEIVTLTSLVWRSNKSRFWLQWCYWVLQNLFVCEKETYIQNLFVRRKRHIRVHPFARLALRQMFVSAGKEDKPVQASIDMLCMSPGSTILSACVCARVSRGDFRGKMCALNITTTVVKSEW